MQPTDTAAHAVVTHPEQFYSRPAILAAAWDILMSQRGKRVDLKRLGAPAHLVEVTRVNPVIADMDECHDRVIARIRAHVSRLQADRPTGGDAA